MDVKAAHRTDSLNSSSTTPYSAARPPHSIYTQSVGGATVIAGGGPAGLTAAYELTKSGFPCVVLESEASLVGGISRTDTYKGIVLTSAGTVFSRKTTKSIASGTKFWAINSSNGLV